MVLRVPDCRHVLSAEPGFFGYAGSVGISDRPSRHVACDARYPGPFPGDPWVWPGYKSDTGLFAARMAQAVGYAPVILAGVRIDDSGYVEGYVGHSHYPDANPQSLRNIRETWWAAFNRGWLAGVRSMSGWTAELLGRP
jgi:hypothetical protein